MFCQETSFLHMKNRIPVDSLFALDTTSPWNARILENESLVTSSCLRQRIVEMLERIYTLVPRVDTDFGMALEIKLVTEQALAELYESLNEFLQEEAGAERLLLYFPMELVPGSAWKPQTKRLSNTIKTFTQIYKQKLRLLLTHKDLRANFTDGDIPEEEIRRGPLPQVVKAVHLIPPLVLKGTLNMEWVDSIHVDGSDRVLEESLEEIRHLLTYEGGEKENPKDSLVRDSAWLKSCVSQTLEAIRSSRQKHLATLAEKPEARVAWETLRDDQKLVTQCSSEIAEGLMEGSLTTADLEYLFGDSETAEQVLIGIVSVRMMIDNSADYEAFKALVESIGPSRDTRIHEALESLRHRVENAKPIPRQEDMVVFEKIAEAIETDQELSEFLFPVIIAYGSRIKGCSTKNGDVDFAVMVRPGTPFGLRSKIQTGLKAIIASLGVHGKALEFWLEERSGHILVRDFGKTDRSLADSSFGDTLLQGAWFGEEETIRRLYEEILEGYLESTYRVDLLREMERVVLQYRLMHKGYHHFHSEQRSACVQKEMVDYQGAFWDPGYRRLATTLFLRKVFLPAG
jgi:hypothetical protein